jgi:hypothetical protein
VLHTGQLLLDVGVARIFPFKRPAILLLSYPRSGSSWIAQILSTSNDVAYLREPINQVLQHRSGRATATETVFDPHADATTLGWYTRVADRAFAGIPPDNVPDVVGRASDLSVRGRRQRALLIKEVNPLAAALFVERYAPKVVLVLRHPAAVADSYHRLGWLHGQFETFGRQYGTHLAHALEASKQGWSLAVRYEDLAHDPAREFPRLFGALGIRPPSDLTSVLRGFCEQQNPNPSPYELHRVSRQEADKWRGTMAPDDAADVMRGYRQAPLGYYRDETA